MKHTTNQTITPNHTGNLLLLPIWAIFVVALATALIGCSEVGGTIPDTNGQNGANCAIKEAEAPNNFAIYCGDVFVGYLNHGEQGIQGEKGEQGLQGEKGDTGANGQDGAKGDTGEKGEQGLQGEKGDAGEQGIQGEKGDTGEKGEQGLQGEKGDTGERGEQGLQGDKGDTGQDGAKGDTGEKGEQGLQGDKGDTGQDGAKGDKGETGEQGLQGEKGDTGANGQDGAKGDTGERGEQGLQGDKGDTGERGEQGLQGEKGDTGERGEQGLQGDKGDTGENGTSCTIEPSEDIGHDYEIFCGGVSVGYLDNGENGTNGDDGKDGTSCDVEVSDDGIYFVMSCGGVVKARWAKAMCGTTAYDPEDNFCYGVSIIELCGGNSYDPNTETCTNGNVNFTFTDTRDSKVYKGVKIGKQAWMAENLNYEAASGSWCYQDNPDYCAQYGRLYDWATAMAVCPSGWHLPSNNEWGVLVTYVGASTAGTKLKATSGWVTGNGTDDYGFSAMPGGFRYTDGSFYYVDSFGEWWSATESFGSFAYYRSMNSSDADVYEGYYNKPYGSSVRCVRD